MRLVVNIGNASPSRRRSSSSPDRLVADQPRSLPVWQSLCSERCLATAAASS